MLTSTSCHTHWSGRQKAKPLEKRHISGHDLASPSMTYINAILAERNDHIVCDEDRLVFHAAKAIEREATRKTSNTTKQRLESFGQMMRNKVLWMARHQIPAEQPVGEVLTS